MLTLLLGTDWVSNREWMLEHIQQDVANEKPGCVFVVPELISHDMERRLCMAAGDTASRFAEVLPFTRLCQRVSAYMGHKMGQCLDNGGRLVAMASATRQLHSKLKAYAAVETRPEFLTGLVDAVDEFKRCCISPDDLMAASKQATGSLGQKLEELGLIYECYEALCQNGRRDPCDQMTWLLEELESGDFAQRHSFYIDGFPDFTRQHMAILQHMVLHSPQVTIGLNCDCIESQHIAFETAGDTARQIISFAKRAGVPYEIKTVADRGGRLSHVRQQIFQGDLQQETEAVCVTLFRTDTVYQECLAAAQKIRELVVKGVRYRDISVVCADLPVYKNPLQMVFSRCHIPVYLSGTEDILDKSVVETVLSALDTALGGFEKQDVFHYIKSSLSPIDLPSADLLENYAQMWEITGSRWLQAWTYHPQGLGREWTEEAQSSLARLNSARQKALEPLLLLRNQFRDATNLCQQVQALYGFFEKIGLRNRLEMLAQELDSLGDRRNAQILNQLWEILLTALEQLQDMLGQTAWSGETFTHLLRLLLSQYDVGTIPPVLDSVMVGSFSSMRCQQEKHLIVLGALEGALPSYAGVQGVLTDQERCALRQLGVPLTGGAMEGLQAEFAEIYGVFCGADETITVSCPSGQSSFVYQRLSKLTQEITPNVDMALAICDPLEAGAYLVKMDAAVQAEDLGLTQYYERIFHKRSHSLGDIEKESIQKIYGNTLNLSASQVDKLADCRLSYFLRYGLRLQEQKAATVDPAEFGTYVHAVLEHTAREIKELGGFHNVSLSQTLEIADKYSEQYTNDHFRDIDSQRLNYLFARNSRELVKIVTELWEELQNSDFEPLDFEVSFGDDGQMPAICIHGQKLEAKLRGFVDRVDLWKREDTAYYRVVDYKTGKKDFDYCDVFNGYGLQMLLYLFALEEEGESLLGKNRRPAGVEYFPARVPLVSSDGVLTPDEADQQRSKLWKRKGLILSDDGVLEAMEKGEKVIRLPISRRKDGSITGDIADEKQFALLKLYVFGLVGKMVDDIASGNVTPNPYTRGSTHNACSFCPYGEICHMETVENRRNFKAMSPQRFWEEIQKEVLTND